METQRQQYTFRAVGQARLPCAVPDLGFAEVVPFLHALLRSLALLKKVGRGAGHGGQRLVDLVRCHLGRGLVCLGLCFGRKWSVVQTELP